MKKLLLILLCLPLIGLGQSTSPSVLSSSGNSYSNGNMIMDYTLGEIVIETFQPPLADNILTQGFHQEILKVIHTEIGNINIQIKIYPNPASSYLIIEVERNINADVLVYDMNGKLIIQNKLNNEKSKQLNFGALKQGNYLLHINMKNKQSVYQINKTIR